MLFDYRTDEELFPDPDVCRTCGGDVADCPCAIERARLYAEHMRDEYLDPRVTDYGCGMANPDTITRDNPEYWDMWEGE